MQLTIRYDEELKSKEKNNIEEIIVKYDKLKENNLKVSVIF